MTTRIMVQLNVVRSITCCLFWIILLVSITEVYNQNTTVYGYEGDTVILRCQLTPPAVSGRTTWKGPPSSTVYFYNAAKNPNVNREERLSVMQNTVSGAYDLQISNIVIGVDDGIYSCVVNTVQPQEYFVILKFKIEVSNISISPNVNPLTIGESIKMDVRCVVNNNADPSPNITWHLGSTDITSKAGTDSTLIMITGNRTDNGKTLECRASNNNKPPKTASTTLNVEYSPSVYTFSEKDIIEGRNLSVTCQANPGNPSSTTFYWTKVDNPGFRQNEPTLQLHNIQRTSSGTYRCTAENIYSNGEKGIQSQSMVIRVFYPPKVKVMSQQNIFEGRDLSVTCQATPGNPSSTTFYWTKIDNYGFRQNGSILQLPNIQRTSSGTYRCTADNNYSNGERGTDSQSMVINVLYPPIIENRPLQIVNKSDKITLTREILSNPLSNVSWYKKTDLLITQTSVKTASFTIERATCTDTMNYTLVASNGVGNIVTAIVELIVHCKPISDKTNITLGVTCTTGIEFSTTIIAYPEPQYELQYENGTRNNHMITTIIKNDVNNFTVQIKQDVVGKSSFGVYHLKASNIFGGTTVIVNVIEQRRPDHPRKLNVICEETGARVQWISSFNGGEPQYFTVITLNSKDGTILSYRLLDKGENEIHSTYITNLQPSVTYWFSVSAKNSHGSSSSNVTSCKTIHVKETASSQTGVVAGSVIGALMLVTIIIIIVICAHRQYTCIIGFEKKNRDVKIDTKKDASNYTSIKEQQGHTQRDMYDKLTPNEDTNQYEAIRQTDNRGNNEQLYEQLQEKESIAKEGNSDNQNIPLKSKDSSDDKFVAQYAEEYMNTSFVK